MNSNIGNVLKIRVDEAYVGFFWLCRNSYFALSVLSNLTFNLMNSTC